MNVTRQIVVASEINKLICIGSLKCYSHWDFAIVCSFLLKMYCEF